MGPILAGLIAFLIVLKVFSLLSKGRCKSPVCLVGKTALITGGSSGIGYETALGLAGRGCRVIIADIVDCEETKRKIIEETGNANIITKNFDLASFKSIRNLAEDINRTEKRLDILINNAGVGKFDNEWTQDNLNIGMQINHFGPFLLTHLLIGLLKKSAPSRIIFVSSIGAFVGNLTVENLNPPPGPPKSQFAGIVEYNNSKLCTVITANELAKKLDGTGVAVNSLHPGMVLTPIYRKTIRSVFYHVLFYILYYPFIKTPKEGAQTTLHLATAKEAQNTTGKYFVDCRSFLMPFGANSPDFAKQIWKKSEDLVKLAPKERL